MDTNDIRALIEKDPLKVKTMYYRYRDAFFGFGRKYNVEEEALADLYQDAFVALRKQAVSGNLDQVKSSMKTYLFGIGKHMIFNYLKQRNRMVPLTSDPEAEVFDVVPEVNVQPALTEEQRLLHVNFKKLGEKCRQMLTLFYYRGLTIKEISDHGDYANEGVVRSLKSRCLKTLRDLIKGSQ